ncbi:hypothetical protein DJ564_12185 [Pseudomonas sp. 31-12]|nr:hypothetical protein DJ564_12185 [Pseudomonas sp. 31-12]
MPRFYLFTEMAIERAELAAQHIAGCNFVQRAFLRFEGHGCLDDVEAGLCRFGQSEGVFFYQMVCGCWLGFGFEGVPGGTAAITSNARFHQCPVTVTDGIDEFSLVDTLQVIGAMEAYRV